MVDISGKIALMTGASHGIGRACAIAFAKAGAAVAFKYKKRKDSAEEVCSKIEAPGRKSLPIDADVTRIVRTVKKRLGVVAIRIFGLFVLLLLLSCGAAFSEDFNAVILMYHRFGEDRYPSTNIRLEQFDRQLDYLEKNGFAVVSLEAVVEALNGRGTLSDYAVAITVDDAYSSVYENAFPRLKARGWPFTVFVSTDAVDKHYPGGLTWDQMREMKSHGVTFANHTGSHAHLLVKRVQESETEYLNRIHIDIDQAQKRLVKELGSAPPWFAYPYGEYSERIADLVVEMGYVAFGQQSGAVGPRSDLRALPRFPMNERYGNMEGFRQKISSLAMPVTEISPFDPVTSNPRPQLEIILAGNDVRSDQLACYVSGQGHVQPRWLVSGRRFSVQSESDLSPGRNRYNCTMPNRDGSRYYWFSQQWIVEMQSSR